MTQKSIAIPRIKLVRKFCDLKIVYSYIDKDTSLLQLQIEQLNTDSSDARPRAQLQIQNIQMINVSRNKEDDSECEVEMNTDEISKVRVCKILSDGNRILRAAVHQRFHLKVGSNEYKQRTVEFRKEVVDHIRSNFKRYERKLFIRSYF